MTGLPSSSLFISQLFSWRRERRLLKAMPPRVAFDHAFRNWLCFFFRVVDRFPSGLATGADGTHGTGGCSPDERPCNAASSMANASFVAAQLVGSPFAQLIRSEEVSS